MNRYYSSVTQHVECNHGTVNKDLWADNSQFILNDIIH